MLLNKLKLYVPGVPGSDTVNEPVTIVSLRGNDATARRLNPDYPYRTIKAAINGAQEGDYLQVYPGYYDENSIPVKNGIILYMMYGAVLSPSDPLLPIISDVFSVYASDFIYFTILGEGQFINNGRELTDAIVAQYPFTRISVDARFASSVFVSNGAVITLNKTTVDGHVAIRNGSTMYANGCFFHNADFALITEAPNIRFIAKDCRFVRNGINYPYYLQYGMYNFSCFVFDVPALNVVLEFHRCHFASYFVYPMVVIGSHTNEGSYVSFYNCFIYSKVNASQYGLIYDDRSRAGLGNISFYFSGNLTNCTCMVFNENGHFVPPWNKLDLPESAGLSFSPGLRLDFE